LAKAGVDRRLGAGTRQAHPTPCRPFCSGSHAGLFRSPETPLRSLGSIVHALLIRGTDLFLHRYQDDGAARAADRKSPNPPPGGTSLVQRCDTTDDGDQP